MSADDWIPCPFCIRKYRDEVGELELKLKEAYETMMAKDYDKFKAQTNRRLSEIKDEEEDKAYLRIDGTSNYWFDEAGNFHSGLGAMCPHCKRQWQINGKGEPRFK